MSQPQHDESTSQARGVLEMVVASVSLGTLGPVAGLGYQAGLTPATLSALRAAVGAGLLGLLVASGRQPRVRLRSLPPRQLRMLVGAVVANGLQNLFLFFAFGEMTVALVLLLFWLNPGLIAVGSAAIGRERLTPTRVGALAVAGLGMLLVLGSQVGPDAHGNPTGVVLALLAAICHATYYLVVRDGFPSVPAVQATSLVLFGGMLISGSVAIVVEGAGLANGWLDSPAAWAAILVAGTVGAAFPKVLVIRSVRTIGGVRASLVALFEPVTGVVVAGLVLGQTLTPAEILGGAAILLAAAVVQRPDPRAEVRMSASPPTEVEAEVKAVVAADVKADAETEVEALAVE